MHQIKSLYDLGLSRDAGASMGGWPGRSASLAAAPSDGTAAAAATAAAQYELQGLVSAPWDWSLKTRVRIAAPKPLACLQDAAAAGLLPACRAAARPCSGPAAACTAPPGVAQEAAAVAERLQRALLQWQHPASALGADALQAMRSSKATAELLAARAKEWRDCLRALHTSVRNGQCPAAYIVGAQVRAHACGRVTLWVKPYQP